MQQFTWLLEMSSSIRKYSRVAATYEAYFSHRVPAYAKRKYSQRALAEMLHNAIVKGEPISEFRDYVSSHSMDEKLAIPPRPQAHRQMFRDWYLNDCAGR